MADQEDKSRAASWTAEDSKQSLYFPVGMIDEIAQEAQRLQRSMSWVMQRAWKHARRTVKAMPSRPRALASSRHLDSERLHDSLEEGHRLAARGVGRDRRIVTRGP